MKQTRYAFIYMLLIFLLLVGYAAADYPCFHYDTQRTGYVPQDGPLNDTVRWSADLDEFIGAPPIEKDGRVYIGVWPDMNFAAGEEYYLYCLDAADGSEIWKNPLGAGEGTVSGAAIAGTRLFVGCMDGKLYCIDITDGSTLWSAPVDTGRSGGNWYGLAACPAVLDDTVYVTSLTDGTLHAFDLDGNEVWTYATGNATFAYSSPAVDTGRVYFAGKNVADALYCIDAATHQEIWNATTDGQVRSAPVIGGDTVFVTSANRLYAFDTGDGSERWNTPISASWGTPAVAGGYLYLGTNSDAALHCYNAATGAEEWSFTANGKVDTSPVVAGDVVYFASNTGSATVYAVDTAGNEVWQYATTDYLQSSPAVSDGTLYIGSDEGNLYAFGEGARPEPPFPGWSGSVTLTENRTFTVTPFNNASETYTFNRTSALGALDTAATAGGFNYTVQQTAWGAFLYSIGGIAYNETSWDSWLYSVNDVTADVGAADYELSDGDVVTYWYGAWGSSPATADAVVNISVSITPEPTPTLWNGTVTLAEGQTCTVTPFNNASATYTFNRTSALGALDAAATAGEFNYTVQETAWGPFLYSIAGIAYNETSWDSWLYSVNGITADVGAADYQLKNGDIVTYWYGGWGSSPATANAVVNLTVSITPKPSPILWNGTVTLVRNETFPVVPFNNESATYTINRTSALGALDTAATAGGFNYTVQETAWGPFLYSIDGIAYNETSWDSWLYSVNGVTAAVGATDYELSDGDVVTYWYGAWGSSPETADHVVTITVAVRDFAWEGSVSLTNGQTFTVTPFNNASTTYTFNRTSALGALDAAATAGEFNYTVQQASWGPFLYSIGSIEYNETSWDSWLFEVNGVTADVGAADYELSDGDIVTYWYGAWGSSPETADAVVTITVSIAPEPTPTPTPGGGGGDDPSLKWITVTLEAGTFTVTADNSKEPYTVNRQTALGALDAAGAGYVLDDSYYQEYGSLFIDSVNGRANEGTKGWMYQVNGASPAVGANTYMVKNGDEVVFFWSEGMGSTPATSPDVIPIRVVIPSSSGGSDSGSSGGGGGGGSSGSSSGTAPQGLSAATSSFAIGLPAGATVELAEWGQTFSINLQDAQDAGERVGISGNRFVIGKDGMTMTITAENINEENGVATGLVRSVVAAVSPVTATFDGLGTVAGSLDLNLTGVPADGRVLISFNITPDAGAASAFQLAAAEDGDDITAVAYTMSVTRINLENGDDIAGATIRMTVSPVWVEEHGGVDAVRIVRSAEDGVSEILDARIVGTDDDGNFIVEAFSPRGLSIFGLIAVEATSSAAGAKTISTAAADADGASAAAAAPAGSPLQTSALLIIVAVALIIIAGAAYFTVKRRNEEQNEEKRGEEQ